MDQNQYRPDATPANRHTTAGQAVEDTQEIDLLLLFNALRRHILIIIAVALVFALVAGIYVQFFITPLYNATTSTYLVSADVGFDSLLSYADLQISKDIIGDYSDIIKSRTILEAVINNMKLPYSYGTLYGNVSVVNPTDTHIIKITVTDTDPVRARDIANYLTHYAVERLSEIMEISTPNVYDEAIVPSGASYPRLTRTVTIAFVLGAVLAAGVIVFITIMDTTVKTAEDIENRCGMVTLTKVYFEGGKKKKGYGYGSYGSYGYGYGDYGRQHSDKSDGGSENGKSGGSKKK